MMEYARPQRTVQEGTKGIALKTDVNGDICSGIMYPASLQEYNMCRSLNEFTKVPLFDIVNQMGNAVNSNKNSN